MAATASAPAGETSAAPFPRRHHAVELELNACGVECCPHDAHKGLVAVASYLHQPGDEDKCGLLPQSLHGARDAAADWEKELSGFLYTLGFYPGQGEVVLARQQGVVCLRRVSRRRRDGGGEQEGG